MKFEYTDQEYRTECLDGCGALTVWLQSSMVADQAGNNHENSEHHRTYIEQRMRQEHKGFGRRDLQS